METQKTLEDLARQMDECVAQLEAMGPAMHALGDIEVLVSFDDLKARFATPVGISNSVLNAVRV